MRTALFALLLSVAATSASGQEWPSRTITWIVPFPAGGTVDQPARLLAEQFREALNWQIVVENKPGASGMIGTSQVARSAADGYTWGFVFDTHVTNPTLQPNITYDSEKDLRPVFQLGRVPFVIVTNPDQPFKSFVDVVKAAKAKPRTLNYAVTGLGTLGHLTMAQLQATTGTELVAVPYRGGPPAVQDVLANHVPLYIGSPTLVVEHVKAGRLRPLAYTGRNRSTLLPDVPTLGEQGFGDFTAQAFIGVVAPAGVPKDILDQMAAHLRRAAQEPKIKGWANQVAGLELDAAGPAEFERYLSDETARWRQVIRTQSIRLE